MRTTCGRSVQPNVKTMHGHTHGKLKGRYAQWRAHPACIQNWPVAGAAAEVAIKALLQRLNGGGLPLADTPLDCRMRGNHKSRCAVAALRCMVACIGLCSPTISHQGRPWSHTGIICARTRPKHLLHALQSTCMHEGHWTGHGMWME